MWGAVLRATVRYASTFLQKITHRAHCRYYKEDRHCLEDILDCRFYHTSQNWTLKDQLFSKRWNEQFRRSPCLISIKAGTIGKQQNSKIQIMQVRMLFFWFIQINSMLRRAVPFILWKGKFMRGRFLSRKAFTCHKVVQCENIQYIDICNIGIIFTRQ